MCKDSACVGDGPRYIPILLLFTHLSILLPCCIAFSKTYAGQLKGCSVYNLDGWLAFVNSDSGNVPYFDLGVRLNISFANLIAYGHSCGAAASLH